MAQATHLARTTSADRALTQAAGTNYTLVQSTQTYVNDVAAMLADAVWYIDAAAPGYAGGQTVANLGTGGTALDAQMGSGSGADSNDPTWLDYSAGDAYLYQSGANAATVPHSAAIEVTGDIDIAVHIAAVDWTPSANTYLIRKGQNAASDTYGLLVLPTGLLQFTYGDGSARLIAASTGPSFTDGTAYWVRVTKRASDQKVKFYKSSDPASTAWASITWAQVGTDVTVPGSGTATGNAQGLFLGTNGTTPMEGAYHRAIVRNGFDGAGSTVLDVDTSVLTDGAATTFVEQSSNAATVTINRTTSGRKSVAVVAPVWLLGTDDYMEVPDSADLDFGASDDFTVLAVVRKWANAATTPILFKRTNDLNGSAGWNLYTLSTGNAAAKMSDGTNVVIPVRAYTAGALSVIGGVRDVTADTLTTYVDGTGTSASDTTTATLANSEPLRVGRYSGGSTYGDFEFIAGAVWRRALTAAEVTALTTYFTTRG
jgi:hypothetical protein